uniref:Uncharacterized protein n=1 Tax=Molossus molossus TaxID=27622 RepID=A0A7J8CZL9_MOLMO|nr:hypothetical protein HJG59_009479 [Molossus molossus]
MGKLACILSKLTYFSKLLSQKLVASGSHVEPQALAPGPRVSEDWGGRHALGLPHHRSHCRPCRPEEFRGQRPSQQKDKRSHYFPKGLVAIALMTVTWLIFYWFSRIQKPHVFGENNISVSVAAQNTVAGYVAGSERLSGGTALLGRCPRFPISLRLRNAGASISAVQMLSTLPVALTVPGRLAGLRKAHSRVLGKADVTLSHGSWSVS